MFPTSLAPYHAKYFTYELTKRCPLDSTERLAGAVASAQVGLNPHQVDAALFAFQSQLSKGALLADEVGLGKTHRGGPCAVGIATETIRLLPLQMPLVYMSMLTYTSGYE